MPAPRHYSAASRCRTASHRSLGARFCLGISTSRCGISRPSRTSPTSGVNARAPGRPNRSLLARAREGVGSWFGGWDGHLVRLRGVGLATRGAAATIQPAPLRFAAKRGNDSSARSRCRLPIDHQAQTTSRHTLMAMSDAGLLVPVAGAAGRRSSLERDREMQSRAFASHGGQLEAAAGC